MTQQEYRQDCLTETGNPNPILWTMGEHGLQEKRHGMNHNLNIKDGVAREAAKFDQYKTLIMQCLEADHVELLNGTIMDFKGGIDALYTIRGKVGVYALSLRFRNRYYNSFTMNRHVKDVNSEVNKWSHKSALKPNVHIQISELGDGRVNVTIINVDSFGRLVKAYRDNFPNKLEDHYNDRIDAYEFPESFTKFRGDVISFTRNVDILG